MKGCPWGADVEKIIHNSAWRHSRMLGPTMDRDDLKQEARIRLLRAYADGKVPEDPVHKSRYIHMVVKGIMIDVNQKQWAMQPAGVVTYLDDEIDSGFKHEKEGQSSPDNVLHAKQVVGAFLRLAPKRSARMVEAVELLATGLGHAEVARKMEVSVSCVCQWQKLAREMIQYYR